MPVGGVCDSLGGWWVVRGAGARGWDDGARWRDGGRRIGRGNGLRDGGWAGGDGPVAGPGAGRRAADAWRARTCCGISGALRLGGRKVAGLPELEELLQAAEDARQEGGDQGVHGLRQPGTRSLRPEGGVELGQLVGQRGRLN